MTTSSMRKKLHEIIDSVDDEKATAIYKIFSAEIDIDLDRRNLVMEERERYLSVKGKPDNVPGEVIFLVEESAEGGFTARALGVSIHTEADSMDELRIAVKDAVHCHFDDDYKRIIRLHIVKDEVIAA